MIVGQTGFLCHLEDYDRSLVCQDYGSPQFLKKTKQGFHIRGGTMADEREEQNCEHQIVRVEY